MSNQKPKVMNLHDMLSFGLPALFVTIISLLVQAFTKQSLNAYALMWVMSAGFWFVYAMLIKMRIDFNNKIAFVTKHNICVMFENGFSFKQEELEAETDHLIKSWQAVTDYDVAGVFKDYIYVTFKQGPLVHPYDYRIKLAGYTLGRTCSVGVLDKTITLDHTAFEHELGHIVYSTWKNNFNSNEAEHAFIKEHSLI